MIGFIVNMLITALVVFLCAKFFSGISVKSYGWACVVAIVLAVLNALVSLIPIPGFGGGVVAFVVGLLVDACVIWLADKLLDSFYVDGYKWCLVLAAVLSLVSALIGGIAF